MFWRDERRLSETRTWARPAVAAEGWLRMPSSTSASLPPGASAMPSPINTPALKFSSQENCGRQSTRKVPRWSVDNSIPAMTASRGTVRIGVGQSCVPSAP